MTKSDFFGGLFLSSRVLNSMFMSVFCELLGRSAHTVLIGLYYDDCTPRTLCYSNCSYCAPICGVRTEGENGELSADRYKLIPHVSGILSYVDIVVSNPPILVLGRWGAPEERQ